jgi:hypothetical protein
MSPASFLVTDHKMQEVLRDISFVVIIGHVENTYQATRISESKYSVQLLRLPIPPGCDADLAVLLSEFLRFESIGRQPFA